MRRSWILLLACFSLLGALAHAATPLTVFRLKEPRPVQYVLENVPAQNTRAAAAWARAFRNGSTNDPVEVSDRLVVHLQDSHLSRAGLSLNLELERKIGPGVAIYKTSSPAAALQWAEQLSRDPSVEAAYPVMRRGQILHGPYAPKPNDPYFSQQWHLERRDSTGAPTGPDLNVRAAWPVTRGEGVIVGVGDDGIELTHPDLISRVTGSPHFNFGNSTTNVDPGISDKHATAVAGLLAADLNNRIGCSGVAPGAQLASWKIFNGGSLAASDLQLMDMFQYQSNNVAVQNHSWGFGGTIQMGPTLLEDIGISNAVNSGRGGLGVVICRSGGNSRASGGNSNDDGYPSDPRVIAVGAARFDGRAASYSNPGACLLVAAPSGDIGFQTLFTTDRQGSAGYNYAYYPSDPNLWDYGFDGSGFSGTSGSAPQISGIAALILSANPALSYRDVQQILIFSARHFDLADPDLLTNAAGFRVSHNLGFGIPDSAFAVRLAQVWKPRPPLMHVIRTDTNTAAIPDAGLRLFVRGTASTFRQSIIAQPSLGLHPDNPTPLLPLRDVGDANAPITNDLRGAGALILRGGTTFSEKIQRAADAGAAFAVVYNNAAGGDQLVTMGNTDYSPIPAVFIGQTAGDNLQNLLQLRNDIVARLELTPAVFQFSVTNTLICEHVGVRIKTDHPRRADIRITLVSPSGTRSVLSRLNNDLTAGPVDWTYHSTHHFYESSAGVWRVEISDEIESGTGNVQLVQLDISGVPIKDTDGDGLDDDWEIAHFGSLASRPAEDPDQDGFTNMQEQILQSDPLRDERPLRLDISRWDTNIFRLSWPGVAGVLYRLQTAPGSVNFINVTNVPGQFPETEIFLPLTNSPSLFKLSP